MYGDGREEEGRDANADAGARTDLFDRLRELRGSKTMVFSSHRFGNLTRHADLILYVGVAYTLPVPSFVTCTD